MSFESESVFLIINGWARINHGLSIFKMISVSHSLSLSLFLADSAFNSLEIYIQTDVININSLRVIPAALSTDFTENFQDKYFRDISRFFSDNYSTIPKPPILIFGKLIGLGHIQSSR